MKNIQVAGALCVTLGWSLTPALFAGDKYPEFKVESTKNECKIKPPVEADWLDAEQGKTYEAGSTGKTGGGGMMKVAFDEKNRFRIFPNSEVVIHESTHNPRFQKVIDLAMKKGKVDVELGAFPKGYEMKVQTPTAVCGAMGTAFTVETDPDSGKNDFKCTEHTIKVQPKAYDSDVKKDSGDRGEYGAFVATIDQGEGMNATIRPGKENAFSQVETSGGTVEMSLGSDSNQKLKVKKGTRIRMAQEQADETKEVAFQIENGGVSKGSEDLSPGRFVMNGNEINDVTKDEKGAKLVDQYLAAADVEGKFKRQLEMDRALGKTNPRVVADLEEAAKKATQIRRELFHYRDEIRRAVREGMDATRGGGRPTQIPRGRP